MPTDHGAFVVPDYRRPDEPMQAIGLKLPPDAVAELQAQAKRFGCSRGALGRALMVRGLQQLSQASEVA